MSTHTQEVASGERFQFGQNWSRFLSVLNDERIEQAEISLKSMLGVETLEGKTLLDVGSGSGLFSLVAHGLGAKVHSFDYDPQSVACTREMKRRYSPQSNSWVIEEGSALDRIYLARLGQFDVVYSWGVLHHTGAMWEALGNMVGLVRPSGKLYIAIYNTQTPWTPAWTQIKRVYNRLPRLLRVPYVIAIFSPLEMRALLFHLLTGKPSMYVRRWTHYHSMRGMNRWHDIIDWVGGYPFETAKPEEIFDFYKARDFALERLFTCGGGLGCNEYVFSLPTSASD